MAMSALIKPLEDRRNTRDANIFGGNRATSQWCSLGAGDSRYAPIIPIVTSISLLKTKQKNRALNARNPLK